MSCFTEHIERVGGSYENDQRIDVQHYEDLVDADQDYGVRVPRRRVVDRSNPLEAIRENDFK